MIESKTIPTTRLWRKFRICKYSWLLTLSWPLPLPLMMGQSMSKSYISIPRGLYLVYLGYWQCATQSFFMIFEWKYVYNFRKNGLKVGLGIHFQNYGINIGKHFQKFGIHMGIHFDSWGACPYPKLGQVPYPFQGFTGSGLCVLKISFLGMKKDFILNVFYYLLNSC